MIRPFRRSYGDMVTGAGPGGARGSRLGLRLLLAGTTLVVSWGLFIVALVSGSVTGDRDTSFVVITLIYALLMTPAAVCLLWPDQHGYAWTEDDHGLSGPGT